VADRADGQQDQEATQDDRQHADVGDLAELPGHEGCEEQRGLAAGCAGGQLPQPRQDNRGIGAGAQRSARRVP
jgi:hypothetical protein